MPSWFKDAPIQRKLMLVIFLTSFVAMLLMRGAFFTYEFITFRQATARQISTLGKVVANNSTAALAFQNQDDAREVLSALTGERFIVAAALYDEDGKIFASYPADISPATLPAGPGAEGYGFESGYLAGFQPVVQRGKRLGTLYLRFETRTIMSEWLSLSLGIALAVVAVILIVIYALSRVLQRQITRPILALADAAGVVSESRDHTVRVARQGADEVGLLTDAFNRMLAQIQAQDQLRARLEAIVESSDDAIIGKTLEGIITNWNAGAEKIFGFTAQEIVGRPMLSIIPADRPDEEPDILARVARGESVEHFETVRLRKNGTRVDISATVSPIKDASGRVIGASTIAQEITEQRRERVRLQFRAFFESLPGLFLVLTPDLEIVAVSDAYLKATMTERDAIVGRRLFEVFPDNPDDPNATGSANLRASLERVSRNLAPDTMAIQKYDVRRPDGEFEERYWSPVNSPVFDSDRRLTYIIHRVEDVTEFVRKKKSDTNETQDSGGLRARMEQMEAEIFRSSQEVQMANRQLHDANAELEAFSYSVSHDLRAPLRHIHGFATLLEKQAGSLDATGRRHLDIIRGAAQQMGRLIDDLLAFSRTSRSPLAPAQVGLDELVAAVIRDGRYETDGRAISWKISPLSTVRADPAMLRQVWANLIDNAVKYSAKAAQPCIIIRSEGDAATGERVFSVADNGVGFDMAYAGKLFGVFQRLHGPSEFEGTGIGLANVRRIVARHGGRTWAEGRVGEGATFYFSLPVVESTASP